MSVRVIFLEKNPDEESINYYFSKDPMSPDNMPAPISVSGPSEMLSSEPDYGSEAVGWTVDWDREEDAYVRVGVVKNGIESISNEWVYEGSSGYIGIPWTTLEVDIDVPDRCYGLHFSPSGMYLAIGHRAGDGLTVISTENWTKVKSLPTFEPSLGSVRLVRSVRFSPCGRYLAAGTNSSDPLIVIDTYYWSRIEVERAFSSPPTSLSFSPCGEYLAGTQTNRFVVMKTDSWSSVGDIPSIPGNPMSVDFSPCGKYLAVGHSQEKMLTVIDVEDWEIIDSTPSIAGGPLGIRFSPSGEVLAVSHYNGNGFTAIRTSDWSVIKDTPTFSTAGMALDFTPSGRYIAVYQESTDKLNVIDANEWVVCEEIQLSSTAGIKDIAFSPSGYYLSIGGRIDENVLILLPNVEGDYYDGSGYKDIENDSQVSIKDIVVDLYSGGSGGAVYVAKPVVEGTQSLFIDDQGTVPVKNDGDKVGMIFDLSGNGNHAIQPDPDLRPTYRHDGNVHWIEADGSICSMISPLQMSIPDKKISAVFSFRHTENIPAYVISDTEGNVAQHGFGYLALRNDTDTSTTGIGASDTSSVGEYSLGDDFVVQINADRGNKIGEAYTLDGNRNLKTSLLNVGDYTSSNNLTIMSRYDGGFGILGRLYGAIFLTDSNTEKGGQEFLYISKLAGF